MADRRLEEIRTSDDQESKINVELIEWLKTTGVNILLVILLIVIAFRGYLWWKSWQQGKIDAAWADFAGTDTPAALEALADRTQGYGSIPEMALLQAARQYHNDLLRDQTLELVPETPSIGEPGSDEKEDETSKPVTAPMTEQERDQTLTKMEGLYRRVYDMTAPEPGKPNWKGLLRIQATFGLAAVAEMREQWDEAANWYSQIEDEANAEYPALADLARTWRENPVKERIVFVPQDEIREALFQPVEPAKPTPEGGQDGAAGTEDSPTDDGEKADTQEPGADDAGGENTGGQGVEPAPTTDKPAAPTQKPDGDGDGGG